MSRAILTGILCAAIAIGASDQDDVPGRDAFEKRCSGCHALDTIKAGPPLRGVYGKRAGSNPRFPYYSDALKRSSIVWDESTLDRWLTDTESAIPGSDMAFRLNAAADRSAIIAYLRQLPEK